MIKGLDHVNITTPRLEKTRRFFVDVLGFEVAPRPDFGIPGYWLSHKGRELVHLVEMDLGFGTAALDHFAFALEDYEGMRARLERLEIPYTEFCQPDGSRKQMAIKDPNGVTVELSWRAN